MRDGGVLFLRANQFRDPGIGLARAQEGESEVNTISDGIGLQLQRGPQLLNRLNVGIGILVKGLSKVPMFPKLIFGCRDLRGHNTEHAKHGRRADNAETFEERAQRARTRRAAQSLYAFLSRCSGRALHTFVWRREIRALCASH